MAKKDYTLPFQDLTNLVPQNLRNPMITSLIDNLFNRFLTKDEAVPLYGYVGKKPAVTDDHTPKIPQPDVERDINALIPVLSFKVGSETYSFTIQDLIRKAQVLGISEDQVSWLYSQGNNYAPPIDFDRFTNFYNYYWVAKALPNAPEMAWNPSLDPEYYTIAVPKDSDLDKLNVVAATTAPIVLTGTGFYPQTWEVEFYDSLDALNFSVTATGPGLPPAEATQYFTLPATTLGVSDTFQVNFNIVGLAEPLLAFKIIRDPVYDGDGNPLPNETFDYGDKFTITAPFISSGYTVTPNVGPGIKGKITAVDSLDLYQIIDGVQLKNNDRVLVRFNGTDNGIYTVKPGAFVRTDDYSGANIVAGARVFDVNRSKIYVSDSSNSWTEDPSTTLSNTNNWQESNYWIHRDDPAILEFDLSKVVQATRPIIEFQADVKLNTHFEVELSGGPILLSIVPSISKILPSDAGTEYEQIKTEFNQMPVFDLYKYDGTHANKVSPIFFYVEDPTEDIDSVLQRRVKHAANGSGDFLFTHGLEENNSLLFYKKKDGSLHTIWHPGYSAPTVVDQTFGGTGNGTLSVTVSNPFSAQQIWTLTATGPLTFEVSGSKNKVLPSPYDVITVGTPYDNGLFQATLVSGSTPFTTGDSFVFRIGNFETTRYVYRDSDDAVYDLYGGVTADTTGIGAWQIPRMFYNNVGADNESEVPEGTLYSHFRGILLNQINDTVEDRAFGGSIKLWSEQQNLLAALLMQRDSTPISIIDLAQRQYETSLNAVVDIYNKEIIQYFSSVEVLVSPTDVSELTDYILSIRAKDNDVRTVLYDSTSPVIGFPPTLPLLGVTPLNQPGVIFDAELGTELFKHHDGHLSPLFSFTQSFRDRLLSPGMTIKRSDGTYTPAVGSYTINPPAQPYKGELWFYPQSTTTELRAFNVLSDKSAAPIATAINDYWYNRSANVLYKWNGAGWQVESNMLAPWIVIDPASLLNDVLLEIENRLYDGINAEQRTYFAESEVSSALSGPLSNQLERELATWAATNGYDPFAPDYISTDAFTWNYSSLGMPARWYNALQSHQDSISGVIPTSRPNLEPWKLLGFNVKPGTWDTTYKANTTPSMIADLSNGYITGEVVRTVLFSQSPLNTLLTGLPTVDGRVLVNGDKLLLVSEAASTNNGIWIVSSGAWTRSSTPLIQKTVVSVYDGAAYSGTEWVLTGTATPNIDPVLFEQVKLWKDVMWTDIQMAKPALKLSVDTVRDVLLPPYVNAFFPYSINALTTTLPTTPAAPYQFGEGSPVETVWMKSVEFRYSLARALFRHDPLAFLGYCWGFEWVEVDGILYDGFDLAVPGHTRFRLHGDAITALSREDSISVDLVSGPVPIHIVIEHDGYTALRKQSFSIRTVDETLLGYAHEGELVSITSSGYTITNLIIEDHGDPFRIGDKFNISANADGSGMLITFDQSNYAKINGFGQTFAHALRASAVDANQGYAIQAYRGWSINLGYRAGGLVSTDDLKVFTDSETIPQSSFDLRLKRSPYAKDMWVQGLRISVVQVGANRTAPISGYIPSSDASDWVFRIDGYNSRYLGIEYYSLDTNGDYTTFNALSGEHTDLAWNLYNGITGTIKTQLPLTITGLQNVVNFIHGYAMKLDADGWTFQDENGGNVDLETGRIRNWQLEIEKLIDRVYAGIDLGQGHVVVPFMDRIWIQQDTGLLSWFFDTALFDVTGHPGVFDTLGSKISTTDLTILRSRGKSQISAAVPMFSVHAQLDEYEHLFVFNNLISPSTFEGLIYDPFSGARIVTIKFNGRKQAAQTLRPEFGGHYLVGNEVKRNLQSNTDKVALYYDADHVFEDELSTRHALALLGFSPKQYMADLDISEKSEFNFWRGLIQMKGTNASIDSFLNNDRFFDAKLDEYWAYKVAEYGDSRPKIFPELKLTVDDTLQQFTKFQFDATSPIPTFVQISADDETRWFSIDDLEGETSFEAQIVGEYYETVTAGVPVILPFIADKLIISGVSYTQLNGTTLIPTANGILNVVGYGPCTPKFNPIKLFNYVDSELIEEIPIWHPAFNQHTPAALENINIISDLDPAKYNISTQVIGNANYDPLRSWGSKEVGRVWWDTTNLDYVPYFDATIYTDIDGRLSRWGTLTDYATVDVVEWVESTVPPSEYDAQATIDAGNSDLDPYTKADGQVYGAKTYSRDRVWNIRPIAWSKAGVAVQAAHPSFNGLYTSTLNYDPVTGVMYLETGTFTQAGISSGMRIGGWIQNNIEILPTSEYLITDEFTKYIQGAPSTGDVLVAVANHTEAVGELVFTVQTVTIPILDDDGNQINTQYTVNLTVTESLTGESDVVQIVSQLGNTLTLDAAQTTNYLMPTFGLTISQTLQAGTYDLTVSLENPGEIIKNALNGIVLFDAVQVQAVVAGSETTFSNDDSNVVGWRAWNVPTQAELDADSKIPNSSWYPYVGKFIPTAPTIEVVQDAANGANFTLNNGTIVERYDTSWSDWIELSSTTLRGTAETSGSFQMTVPTGTTVDEVSVYINGVAQLTGTYSIVGTDLTIDFVDQGFDVVVIIRAYSPSGTELEFDPDILDNVLIQRQYKIDYQYVSLPIRSEDGSIISTKYFFWVKNRSTAARKKPLSVKSTAELLISGPSNYLTFQNMIGSGSENDTFRYDAITISGLSYVVTKDDTFKLRFTRNFTLRDDPNGLDLKDTHAEWSLIRPGQKTTIPEALWNKLVDAACGADAAGNPLPAPKRASYDERNGTRTRFGFGVDQIIAPTDLVVSTLLFTILNTSLVDDSGSVPIPDYMTFLDFSDSENWFTPENARNTLTRIWNEAKVAQINELFFAVLEDIVASNYEMTDIFKTSRLSAYSIKVVSSTPIAPTYE